MVQLRDACLRQSKACHFAKRYDKHRDEHHGAAIDKQIIYVVLSTNKEMAENWSPVICSCDSASRWVLLMTCRTISFSSTASNL